MINTRKFYRIKSIALELGIDRTTLFRWERDGKIPKLLRRGQRYAGYTPELMQAAINEASPK